MDGMKVMVVWDVVEQRAEVNKKMFTNAMFFLNCIFLFEQ
jgi:hypothetical protein